MADGGCTDTSQESVGLGDRNITITFDMECNLMTGNYWHI